MRTGWLPLLLLLGTLVGLAACGGDDEEPEGTGTPETSAAAVKIGDLARAVVQIQALDAGDQAVWHGSGTLISEDGLVLTNGHVVDERFDEYDHLGVAITEKTEDPPELKYVAEIAAVDYALDLAVVRIAEDLEGAAVDETFPFVATGNSDAVEIGDEVRILGYPGIGGETITFTDGVVSGFTAERSVGGRAWIKTDATIAGGNSGGLAVDAEGRLIGVPTIVGSGSEGTTVDCRLLEDTNRDGTTDENDTCVSVGGFINGIRPVNLAEPLVTAAEAGREYVSAILPSPQTGPAGGFDTSAVVVSNLVFSEGVTADDDPTEIVDTLPTGVVRVCAFWDYAGMTDGMSWEAVWYEDGEIDEQGSIIGDTWVGGKSGIWWVCVFDEENGLPDGLYEVIISVEGESFGSSAIFVGGDHPPVRFAIENASSTDICYVYLSPSGAQNWGFDRLSLNEGIAAGDTFTLDIPGAAYDLFLQDCAENALIEEYELDISEDSTYTVSGE